MDEVKLYNLTIIGSPLHIISQEIEDGFKCYYPEKISFPLNGHESVVLIENGKVYLNEWVEEGWNFENHCATNAYKYYERVIVKDFSGNILSEEIGYLNEGSDGNWWIS